MSSWVAPSIAAELWQKSLDEVLRGIREGSIPVRHEGGFTFVDIAPPAPLSIPRDQRPPTFVVVSEQERAALLDAKGDAGLNEIATEAVASAQDDPVSYQAVRAATAALRRRPRLAA